MSNLSFVGKSRKRKDGPDKVTGKAVYSQDVKLPGTLTGRILRSPHAHARILRIDTSRAKALPGVKCVITVDDTKGIKHGFVETPRYPPDQEVFARDKVVHIGQEIAAVAARPSPPASSRRRIARSCCAWWARCPRSATIARPRC